MIDKEEKLSKSITFYNAIPISQDNVAITKDKEKCIDCGMCKNTCQEVTGIMDICDGKNCLYCGSCIKACPTGALSIRSDIDKFECAKKSKICIAYVAPAVRVAIGDAFSLPKGEFVQGKVVTALKLLGFKCVFDVTSAADITIIEESAEFVKRIKNNGVLPMFTSCCPSWVRYVELYHPELIPNLSTCKSPISMQSAIVKSHFCKQNELNEDDIFTVAITPCTSKKYERTRDELEGTDAVLTAIEIIELIKKNNIDFKNLEPSDFDNYFSEGTGSGMLFGNSGGVCESVMRTVYKILTNENFSGEKLDFKEVKGLSGVKKATFSIDDQQINVAVVNKLSNVIPLIEEINNGKANYHMIEVMSCKGGCIGGAGLPKASDEDLQKRMNSLYDKDNKCRLKESYRNQSVVKIYNDLLEHPLSKNSDYLLHTYFKCRKK